MSKKRQNPRRKVKKTGFKGKKTAIAALFVVGALVVGYLMGRSSGPLKDQEVGRDPEAAVFAQDNGSAAVIPAGLEDAPAPDLWRLYERANCLCGDCRTTLANCSCAEAKKMKDEILKAADDHPTEKALLDWVASRYGQNALTDGRDSSSGSPGTKTAPPTLLVEPAAYDFGRIPQKTVKHDFRVMNRGNRRLYIQEIATSCGCTTADVDKRTIDPGGEAKLTVTFDPKQHDTVGNVIRTVTLKTTDPVRPITRIRLRASVYKTTHDADRELPAFAYNSAQTLEGYRIATRIPKALEFIPCYCGCGEQSGHQSLKDCFLNDDGSFDDHGSGCNLCDSEAIDVQKWLDAGVSLPEIRRRIDGKYREYGPATPTPPVDG